MRAAKDAGLPSNIQLVTELEAAALAILREKAESNTIKVRLLSQFKLFL
jgi:hypothetical protein